MKAGVGKLDEKYKVLGEYIDGLKDKNGSLIQVLAKAQEIFGYLPRDVQLFIARKLNISGANVSGVVSFYSYFTTEPRGRHIISVCMGTACFVKGAEKIVDKLREVLGIEPGETTEDGMFTLREVRCLGTCSLAPAVMIDGKVYGHVTPEGIEQILDSYRKKEGLHENTVS